MNNQARQKLAELVTTYGASVHEDPRRCEGLLRDMCGDCRREIFLLVSAQKQRVTVDLITQSKVSPLALLLERLTRRLQGDLGLAEDAARWTVESWALALGVCTAADLSRQKKTTKTRSTPRSDTAQTKTSRPKSKATARAKPSKQKAQSARERSKARSESEIPTRAKQTIAKEREMAGARTEQLEPIAEPATGGDRFFSFLARIGGAAFFGFFLVGIGSIFLEVWQDGVEEAGSAIVFGLEIVLILFLGALFLIGVLRCLFGKKAPLSGDD